MTLYPDYIINLATLVSGIFLALFGVFYTHRRKLSVGFLTFGVVFGLITVFFYWRNDILKRQISNTEIESNSKSNAKIAYKNVTSHQLTPPSKTSKKAQHAKINLIQNPSTSSSLPQKSQITAYSPRIEQPELPIEKISLATEAISSPIENLPFGIRLTIQSTVTISPVRFLIECSGPIGKADSSPVGINRGGVVMNIVQGHSQIIQGSKFEFSYESPPLTPQRPTIVQLFSSSKIKVLRVVRLQ